MDSGWYIKTDDGQVEGPLSAAMLKTRAQQGQVTPTMVVRHGSDGKWVSASHVKGLFTSESKESDVCGWLMDQQHPNGSPPARERSHEVSPQPLPVSYVVQKTAAIDVQLVGPALPPAATPLDDPPRAPDRSSSTVQPADSDSTNASRLVPCVDCGKAISRMASLCPNCGCPVIGPSRPDKYPALQSIAGVNKFFAVLVPIACLVGLLIVSNDKNAARPEVIIPLIVYMIVTPLVLWGTAELILLLIGIENNTSTLRGMTVEERTAKEDYSQLLEQRTREAEEEKHARYEKAKRKLSPDLHSVIGTTGKKVAVEIELVAPVSIGSVGTPLGYLDFEVVDNRPGLERFLGQRTKRLTGYIALERIADLALSSEVERVSSWQPPG